MGERGLGNKTFKKRAMLGKGVGALKRGLLPTYKLWLLVFNKYFPGRITFCQIFC